MEQLASSEIPTRIFAPSGKGYTSTKQEILTRNGRKAKTTNLMGNELNIVDGMSWQSSSTHKHTINAYRIIPCLAMRLHLFLVIL